MDWPRARAILLAAFAVVNLILAYSIWGPSGLTADLTDMPHFQTPSQLRSTLAERGLILPVSISIPRTPAPMQFLHVEWPPTPAYTEWNAEDSIGGQNLTWSVEHLRPTRDPSTMATVFWLDAKGTAARELDLENSEQVRRFADDFLRQLALLPPGARLSGVFPRSDKGTVVVEYVPYFDELPVYSGYVKVELSQRGIESISILWVIPRGYTEAPPKAIRPAGEALLRLAGRLSTTSVKPRTVTEIQLGYYAGRALVPTQSGDVQGWDTVPVWRIVTDTGEAYFINAFNGEWES